MPCIFLTEGDVGESLGVLCEKYLRSTRRLSFQAKAHCHDRTDAQRCRRSDDRYSRDRMGSFPVVRRPARHRREELAEFYLGRWSFKRGQPRRDAARALPVEECASDPAIRIVARRVSPRRFRATSADRNVVTFPCETEKKSDGKSRSETSNFLSRILALIALAARTLIPQMQSYLRVFLDLAVVFTAEAAKKAGCLVP